jgi:hypothetical protein
VAVIGRHRLLACLLVPALALRVVVSLAYRPALLFSEDSYWYLHAATRHHLNHIRPYGYSAFLIPLLKIHGLSVIPIVQHLLGLVTAVLLYVLLRRLGVGSILACVGAAPLLFDPLVLDLEQEVMAETLFALLTVCAFLVLFAVPRPAVGRAALVGLLLAAVALTRTIGLVLVVPPLLHLLVRRRFLPAAVMAVVVILPLIGYAAVFKAEFGHFGLTSSDGRFLYGRIAPFADCSGLSLPQYERELCPDQGAIHPPYWYTWRSGSPLARLKPPPGVSVDGVARDFALRIIVHQPVDYAHMVADGLIDFAEPGRTQHALAARAATWEMPSAADREQPTPHQRSAYVRYGGRFATLGWAADAMHRYQYWIYTPGPLLALAALAALAGSVVGMRNNGGGLECLVLLLAGMALVVVPLATVIFSYRYLEPGLVLLPAAGALGADLMLRRRRERSGEFAAAETAEA